MSENKTKFALIDCNNFYVSCERVFDPRMCDMEAIVLSGNDGCVIARSEGAKAMGIKMGEPYFKIKGLVQMAGIMTKSSNLTLYGDMSKRVMSIISQYSPNQEVYSIDESFLEFGCDEVDLVSQMQDLKKKVLKGTGIPVCVGLASTKTLAKLANKVAKSDKKKGVIDFDGLSLGELDTVFKSVVVGDVWGIGQKYADKLGDVGVDTVFDFMQLSRISVKDLLGVNGLRTLDELNGVRCFELETDKSDQQQIVSSRTFGEEIKDFDALNGAITQLARNAINRLRKQNLYVGEIEIFCNTNPFKDKEQKNNISGSIKLAFSAADYAVIPEISGKLREIYKSGVGYKKGGVVLKKLTSSYRQLDLFAQGESSSKSLGVMVAINEKFSGGVKFGSEMNDEGYLYKTSSRSPCYTTDWNQIPLVK